MNKRGESEWEKVSSILCVISDFSFMCGGEYGLNIFHYSMREREKRRLCH